MHHFKTQKLLLLFSNMQVSAKNSSNWNIDSYFTSYTQERIHGTLFMYKYVSNCQKLLLVSLQNPVSV